MATIWRARDRLGREVVLTDVGWSHIIVGHREFVGREADVRAAVEGADLVNRDADRSDRDTHHRRMSSRLHLKVCVEYDAAGTGTVITAHFTQRIKRREQQRWP